MNCIQIKCYDKLKTITCFVSLKNVGAQNHMSETWDILFNFGVTQIPNQDVIKRIIYVQS